MPKIYNDDLVTLFRSRLQSNATPFETYVNNLVDVVKDMVNKDYSATDEFVKNKITAKRIYDLTKADVDLLLDVIKGVQPGTKIGIAQMSSMCFPKRFLDKESIFELSPQKCMRLSDIIDQTFYLGFMYHEVLMTHPKRNIIGNTLDKDLFFKEFYTDALIANVLMKDYKLANNRVAGEVFRLFYNKKISIVLKKEFKIGFLKRNMCMSFLENLYLSGALLGIKLDISTR